MEEKKNIAHNGMRLSADSPTGVGRELSKAEVKEMIERLKGNIEVLESFLD